MRDMYDTIAKTSDDLIADGHNYQMVAGVLIKAAIRLIENHAPSQKDELAGYEWLDSLLPKNDTTI